MIEDRINIMANQMSIYYYDNYYRKQIKHPVRDSFYQNSFKPKYFKYFENASRMFCIRDNFDYHSFIDCCLMEGFKYPAQLALESNWEKYLKYKPNVKSQEREIAENIVSGILQIKKYGRVEKILEDKLIQISLFQNKTRFNPLVLFFSKSFIDFYNNNKDKFVYDINFGIKRYPVFEYPKIIEKIKIFLGNDYFNTQDE